jgi:hypothetical protein
MFVTRREGQSYKRDNRESYHDPKRTEPFQGFRFYPPSLFYIPMKRLYITPLGKNVKLSAAAGRINAQEFLTPDQTERHGLF